MDEKKLYADIYVDIAAWLHIINGLFTVVIGVLVLLLLAGIGVASGGFEATPILSLVGSFIFILLLLIGLPSMLAGFGLLRRYRWGPILAVVVSVFNLVNVPIGTIIGIYTLLVLLTGAAETLFDPDGPEPALVM